MGWAGDLRASGRWLMTFAIGSSPGERRGSKPPGAIYTPRCCVASHFPLQAKLEYLILNHLPTNAPTSKKNQTRIGRQRAAAFEQTIGATVSRQRVWSRSACYPGASPAQPLIRSARPQVNTPQSSTTDQSGRRLLGSASIPPTPSPKLVRFGGAMGGYIGG
jgi:hypothetical protein